jgi:hypothetical protein
MSNWAGSVSGIIIIIMICLFVIAVFRSGYVHSGAKDKVSNMITEAFGNYGDTRVSDRGQGRSNPKHHKVYKKKR